MLDRYFPLETKFGRFWAIPGSLDHIYATAGANLNVTDEYPKGSRMGPIVVNRVTYAASAHLYFRDGRYQIGRDDNFDIRWHEPFMSRYPGTGSLSKDEASQAARDALRGELERAVNAWAQTPEGQQALNSAQAESIREQIQDTIAAIEKAQATEKAMRENLFHLRQQLEKYQDRK